MTWGSIIFAAKHWSGFLPYVSTFEGVIKCSAKIMDKMVFVRFSLVDETFSSSSRAKGSSKTCWLGKILVQLSSINL